MQEEDQKSNLGKAFTRAQELIGIPMLLDTDDTNDGTVDERSLVLYISLYFHAFLLHNKLKKD